MSIFETRWSCILLVLMAINVSLFENVKHVKAAIVEDSGLGLSQLMALLFENPTDLELNFQVMQAQMAEGNLEAAEATLERVLILDPGSLFARFLIAEIRIKLGKLASAKAVLNEIIEDRDASDDTRKRAEGLVESIDSASTTLRHSGGYTVFMGQTENAFGRSQDNQILFIDLPVNNTTKDKSDQFYGYQAYYRLVKDLNVQTPTQIDGGVKISLRDTHDPSLSDVRTVSADVMLVQSTEYRLSGGLFGSYTDVNHHDFSRNIGFFLNGRIPVLSDYQISANATANRSIYMSFEGVADNPGKSSRAYSGQVDVTRPTTFGFLKLGLSTGLSQAQNKVNDYRYEKVQLNGLVRLGSMIANASVSRQSIRYDQADTFVSSKRQKSHTNEASLNLQMQTYTSKVLGTLSPYVNMKYFETSSNIPNYRRDGGEVSVGMGGTF